MKRGILVVDFGTSNVRAHLIDIENGAILFAHSEKYTWQYPCQGFVEINSEETFGASEKSVGAVVKETSDDIEIVGLSFSFIGDSMIAVDKKTKEALSNIILQMDRRGAKYGREMADTLGGQHLQDLLHWYLPAETITGAKILWFKEKKPEIFERANFYTIQQYILTRLGLPDNSDYSIASCMRMMDIQQQCWSKEILDYLQIGEERLGGTPKSAATIIGELSCYGSVKFPKTIPVVLGTHDSDAARIGLGIGYDTKDKIGISTGTFESIGYFILNKGSLDNLRNVNVVAAPLGDAWVLNYATMAGANLEWYTREFGNGSVHDTLEENFENTLFDGSGNVFFIPKMHMAQGTFGGLSLACTKNDLFKSIVEGITFSLKENLDYCQEISNGEITLARCGGGGSKNRHWLQLKADICGIQMEQVENPEVSALGAGIIGCIGLGIYPSIEEAAKQMVKIGETIVPRQELHCSYLEKYKLYKEFCDKQ